MDVIEVDFKTRKVVSKFSRSRREQDLIVIRDKITELKQIISMSNVDPSWVDHTNRCFVSILNTFFLIHEKK